jgi:hypothetical protein
MPNSSMVFRQDGSMLNPLAMAPRTLWMPVMSSLSAFSTG